MNYSNETYFKLTSGEAVKMLRNAPAKSRFALHVRFNAPIIDTENEVFAGGCSSHITISRKEAVRIAGDILSETLEARGGRIPVTMCEWSSGRTYWIG